MENNQQSSDHQTVSQPQSPAASSPRRYVCPRAQVTETPAYFLLQVEMPGIDRQGLEITFENGELTLFGHRAASGLPEDVESLYSETHPVDFRRVLGVDSTIDAAWISAGINQGLPTLTLRKSETTRSRRIEINGLN